MKIPYVNLNLQWKKEKKSLLKIIDQTLSNESWLMVIVLKNLKIKLPNYAKQIMQ